MGATLDDLTPNIREFLWLLTLDERWRAERLSMRTIKEVLRLRAAGHGDREIARSLAISHSTVAAYLSGAESAGVSWPVPPEWPEDQLEARLFPPSPPQVCRGTCRTGRPCPRR